jgi:hypothetical protein
VNLVEVDGEETHLREIYSMHTQYIFDEVHE